MACDSQFLVFIQHTLAAFYCCKKKKNPLYCTASNIISMSLWKLFISFQSLVTKLGRCADDTQSCQKTNSWPQLNFSESIGRHQPIKFSHFFVPPSLSFCFMNNGQWKMDQKLITSIQSFPVLYYFDLKGDINKVMLGEWLHLSLRSMSKDNSSMIEHFAHFLLCPYTFQCLPYILG